MDIFSRVVVDTNILVNQLILPESLPAKILAQVEMRSVLLFSESTMTELADVLSRWKFDRYVSREARKGFIQRIGRIAEFVPHGLDSMRCLLELVVCSCSLVGLGKCGREAEC